VIKVAVGWVGELESSHTDIIKSLIVDTKGLIRVLDKLVNGESGIIGFNNGIRNLGRRNNGESGHHAVWELLTNLGDQKRTHTSTCSTTERVGDLEALEAVAALSFTSNDIKNLVNKLQVDKDGTRNILVAGGL
jgi:hypothetical protein